MSGAVHDIITRANCFGVARGRIFSVSIDLLCLLYNTLALPCECVMMTMMMSNVSEILHNTQISNVLLTFISPKNWIKMRIKTVMII